MRTLILVILVVACLPFLSVACSNDTSASYGIAGPIFSCGNVGDNITTATTTFQSGARFELPCEVNSTILYYTFDVDWGDGTVPNSIAKNMSDGEEVTIYHLYEQVGQYFPSFSIHIYENTTAAIADVWIVQSTSIEMSHKICVTADNCKASIDTIETSSAPCQVVEGFYLLATILLPLVILW